MENRLGRYYRSFPRQMWVLVAGSFVNSLGGALVFPFLTLYLRQRLDVSLAEIGLVFTLHAATSLVAGMMGGMVADRFGRRSVMLVSLFSTSLVLFFLGVATSYAQVILLAAALGLTSPLFQPARDAMVADLTHSDQRTEAYSVLRVSSNLGYAIGPAIGGFLAGVSYLLSFSLAAGASLAFFFVTSALVKETLSEDAKGRAARAQTIGFGPVFRDTTFMIFCGLMILTTVVYTQVVTNLPVYMKETFGLGERYFGWVMSTNAAMVVGLQLGISRASARWPRLPAIGLGSALYGIGVGAIAATTAFPGFIACAVVYTLGEMIIAPVGTAFTADLAPAEMRGRYMGLLGLTWGAAYGIGPALGGLVYDAGFAQVLWLAAGALGLVTAVGYLFLQRRVRARASAA